MTTHLPISNEQHPALNDECWRRIGISGDRTCPELKTFIHCRNCPTLAAAASTFFNRNAPEGYLESWRAILEEPEIIVPADASSVLVFRLDKEWMSLPTTALVEVTNSRTLHRVPHRSSTILEGLVNIRGQIQLCISLHGLLGLETALHASHDLPRQSLDDDVAFGPSARLLVVERSGERGLERWVFRVDEVAGVQRVPRSAMRAVPATVSHASMRSTLALFDWQGNAVGLLDESRVFDGLHALISS